MMTNVQEIPELDPNMFVVKRDGREEECHFDKITSRIKKLCFGLDTKYMSTLSITWKVVHGMYSGISTVELDTLAAEVAASMITKHPDYGILAARIAISNLHKETHKKFSDTIEALYIYVNPETNKMCPMISEEVYNVVMENKDRLDGAIISSRDFEYNYFGFKTLECTYLLKING